VSLRTSPPCVAPAGTIGVFCAFVSVIAHPPSYPPSLGVVLLPTLFTAKLDSHGSGTMRALTPAAPRQCDRPLRSICLAFRASNPQPRCAACTSRALSPPCVQSVPCGSRLRLTSSKLAATPRRNEFVILQAARSHSGCSPPRLGDAKPPRLGDAVAFGYTCGDYTWHRLPLC